MSRRELVLVVLAAAAVSVAMTWPLVLHLGAAVPGDLGDPLLQTWQLTWGAHGLFAWPPDLSSSPAWHPVADSFAFSDPPVGWSPLAVLVSTTSDALVRYGAAFLAAVTVAAVGPYLLARELGAGPLPAGVAGAAAAWAPWRLAQIGHLNVLSSGGIALALFLLLRGHRRRRPALVAAGWLVASWQLLTGLTLGVPFGYLLAVLAAAAAVAWWRAGRPAPPRPVLAASTGGLAVFVGVAALRAVPYLRVADRHPESARTIGDLELFSPPVSGLLAAPADSALWGAVTAPLRADFSWPLEQTVFPGATVVLLAAVGLGSRSFPRHVRGWLAGLAVVATVLALGVSVWGGRLTYLPLFDHLPGWNSMRTPGRLITFTTLALGLLAAAGADRLVRAWSARAPRWRGAAPAVAGLAVVAVLVEGAGRIPVVDVPPPPPAQRGLPAPQLHLPSSGVVDHRYLFWSIEDGHPPLVNGVGAFIPAYTHRVRETTRDFPDPTSVALLEQLGVRTVVLHRDLATGTPWEEVARRPVDDLPLTRREAGGLVVFELRGAGAGS